MQKTMTYSQWVEQYKPVINPDGSLKRYAVRGSEYAEIRNISEKTPGRVWTMLDDGETDWIASGIHFVNRMDYVLTEIALEEGIDHVDVVDEHPEPAVGKLAYGDYVLTDGSGWFDVKGFTVYIRSTGEGVIVDIFDAAELRDGDIDAVVASCYAFDTDLAEPGEIQ